MVTVARGNLTDSAPFPVSDPRIAGQNTITLPVPTSILELDQDYEVFVSACITVTCRHSSPVPFSEYTIQLVILQVVQYMYEYMLGVLEVGLFFSV